MKKTIFFFLVFIIQVSSQAQNPPVKPNNRLPEGLKINIKKDTTPVRFAVSFSETVSGGTNEIQLNKIYNLNPSEISISPGSIAVSKTGLYHFDYYIHAADNGMYKKPVITTFLGGVFPQSSLTFIKDHEIEGTQEAGLYRGSWHFSVEVHINAPATLKLMYYIIGATNASIEGKFIGHLMSE